MFLCYLIPHRCLWMTLYLAYIPCTGGDAWRVEFYIALNAGLRLEPEARRPDHRLRLDQIRIPILLSHVKQEIRYMWHCRSWMLFLVAYKLFLAHTRRRHNINI